MWNSRCFGPADAFVDGAGPEGGGTAIGGAAGAGVAPPGSRVVDDTGGDCADSPFPLTAVTVYWCVSPSPRCMSEYDGSARALATLLPSRYKLYVLALDTGFHDRSISFWMVALADRPSGVAGGLGPLLTVRLTGVLCVIIESAAGD